MTTLLAVLAAPLVLLGLHLRETSPGRVRLRVLLGAFTIAVAAVAAVRLAGVARSNLASPYEWDFYDFWIGARAAVHGSNFYDPAAYRRWSPGLAVSDGFRREVIDVGFKYPPPAMLLFAPLGFFQLRPALALWYELQAVALVACLVQLKRQFLAGSGRAGWAPVAALTFGLAATADTVMLAQSNFLLLLALLLFWRDRGRARAGLWLGLAAAVKPIALLFFPLLLIRRNLRGVVATAATLAVLWAAAAVFFGAGTTLAYLTGGPTARLPAGMFTQDVNQSLPATLFRLFGEGASGSGAFFHPLVAIPAVLLGAATWLLSRKSRERDAVLLPLWIGFALLVYPSSLEHYAVLLLAALLAIWDARQRTRRGTITACAILLAVYALVAIPGGHGVLFANALVWCAAAWAAARPGADEARPTFELDAEAPGAEPVFEQSAGFFDP